MNSRIKKIVIVCHYYPPHIGGIEIVARQQAQGLTAKGHDVCVVTSKTGESGLVSIENGTKIIRVKAINIFEKWGVPFPIFSPRLLPVLATCVKGADIVHIHDVFYISSILAAILARIYKKPIVLTQHIAVVDHPSKLVVAAQNIAYSTVGRFIFKWSSIIFTYNDRVSDFLIDHGAVREKIKTLVNGVDTKLFYSSGAAEKQVLKKQFNFNQNKKTILFVGRFVPKKGFDKLLAAASDEYQLVFAGGDSGQYKSCEQTMFYGKLSQVQLAQIYRAADLFVLPSKDEGFPLCVQEAMACGLPAVVGYDKGYARYNFDGELMRFIKNPTAKSLHAVIAELINDEKLLEEMGDYSLNYARNNFSWPAMIQRIEEAYDGLSALGLEPNKTIVTTSWDDGHILDLRLADLLKKNGLKGTFYIAPNNQELSHEQMLSRDQIKELSKNFEIGAHTINHNRLPRLSDAQAREEMERSKNILEEITGKSITSFCYPGGEYQAKHVKMAHEAGFSSARTVKRHSFGGVAPLEAKTTIHAYNHLQDIPKIIWFARFNPVKIIRYLQWDNLAIAMFDRALETGGEFHLWGHSWEIDKHNDWERLERVFAYISGRKYTLYLTNSELALNNQKNILITTPYFPPQIGGVEFYVYNISRRLQNDFGWKVTIATAGGCGFLNMTQSSREGLNIYYLPYWFKISNTPINPLWPLAMAKIIKKERIYLINSHSPVPFFSDSAALAAYELPFVLTYHAGTMRKNKFFMDLIIWLYEHGPFQMLLRRANHIICSSDFIRFNLLNDFTDKSSTITPAVDIEIFKPGKKDGSNFIVLFVAGLSRGSRYKGLNVLIDAFGILSKSEPNILLNVVGEGNMRREYENYAKKIGLNDKIVFCGKLLGNDLAEAYRQCDVLILPSLEPAESFGMVLIEAMASGKPVIGTTSGGIPLVIDHEVNGLLVPNNDSRALALAIKRFIDDPEFAKRCGEAGRKKAVNHYDWDRQTAKYDKILRAALKLQ